MPVNHRSSRTKIPVLQFIQVPRYHNSLPSITILKKLVFSFWLAIVINSFYHAKGQDLKLFGIFPAKEGKAFYEKVILIDSTSKDELFKRAKRWVLANPETVKDASIILDQELGIIVFTYNRITSY